MFDKLLDELKDELEKFFTVIPGYFNQKIKILNLVEQIKSKIHDKT